MAIQLAVATRNARIDAIASDVGASPFFSVWSGSMPANAAASTTGTKLVEYSLGSSWIGAASGGAASFSDLPITEAAVGGAPTNAGYWRLFKSDNATCKAQGTVSLSGGGGDAIISVISITSGENVTLEGFTFTDADA